MGFILLLSVVINIYINQSNVEKENHDTGYLTIRL